MLEARVWRLETAHFQDRRSVWGWYRLGSRPGSVCGEDYVGGGLDPIIVVVEAGVGFDGSQDCLAGDFGFDAALHDVFKNGAEVIAAEGEEVKSDGVAVKRVASEAVDFSDTFGPAPHDEGAFDGVALGMVADLAFAAVTLKKGFVRFVLFSDDWFALVLPVKLLI